MSKLKPRSNVVNDASVLDELDFKTTVQKNIKDFKDHAENKVFDSLKDATYWKNLKRDIQDAKGIENPVICFPDGTLIEGHSRIKVLRELIEEGKIPKDYKVPTLIFKGSKDEGSKRLILGNLNRFEVDPNTRTLLFAKVYPGLALTERGAETVSASTPTQTKIAEEMGISDRQLRNEKALVQGAIKDTGKPLNKLKPDDIQKQRDKKNKDRREPKAETVSASKSLPKGSKRIELDLSADEVKVLAQYLSLSDYYETLKQILKSGEKADTLREVFEKITKALNK